MVIKVGDDFGARLSLQKGKNSRVDDAVDGFKYEEVKILDAMVGFEDEELKIPEELDGGEEGLKIISIIGMPGLGKTTLAKKMYNHPRVIDKFDRISWCTVSQEYKRKRLLVDILKGLDSQVEKATLSEEREDDVGICIHKTLKGRRYFVVVDDIWELSAWEDIKRYFPNEGNGSRILFTSRNKEVADQCNSTIYALPLLSHDQCWELLKMKVLNSESCHPDLQEIGEEIASKCNGVPLVVVVVAGILSSVKKDLSAWVNVKLTLDSYVLSYQDKAVEKSLELSYTYLPHHLKPCFLYFGMVREDELILAKTLMQLWIAEGFILADKKKRAEDIAKEYLKELINKNLVMVVETNYDGQAKICIMHDLLRDLCLKIVEEDNFLKVGYGDIPLCNHEAQRMICHSLSEGWFLPYAKYIRSVFCISIYRSRLNIGHMKVLRILVGNDSLASNLVGIQNLVHLRFCAMSSLPEPIGRFSSLEFLVIQNPVFLSSSLLDEMKKLRYLSANVIYLFFDGNTSQTYDLEHMSKVCILNQDDEQWLKLFPHIRRLKCDCDISELRNHDFGSFTQLESLSLIKCPRIVDIKLVPSIKKLSLTRCVLLSWEQMSIIGALPNLEVLKLWVEGCGGEVGDKR